MPRIGAEYGDGEVVAWVARRIFLAEAEEIAPEILGSLRGDVLPHYQRAWAHEAFPTRELWARRPAFFRRDLAALAAEHPDSAYGQLRSVGDSLSAWSDRFHLCDDWCLKVALYTLYGWSAWPRLLESRPLRFSLPSYGGVIPEGPDHPSLELPDWEPTFETWDSYEARAVATFRAALRTYREAARTWAAERDLPPSPQKNAPRGLGLSTHFSWLVRFQCLGDTHKAIADEANRTENTVAAAIRSTATLLSLTRRSVL